MQEPWTLVSHSTIFLPHTSVPKAVNNVETVSLGRCAYDRGMSGRVYVSSGHHSNHTARGHAVIGIEIEIERGTGGGGASPDGRTRQPNAEGGIKHDTVIRVIW